VLWATERAKEFDEWWETLGGPERRQIAQSIQKLEEAGPNAGRPLIDTVSGSRHANMKELRSSQTLRVFFAFDPQRKAALLIGGDKAGKAKRFYRQMIAKADRIYDAHLAHIEKGAPEDGR